MVLGVEAPGLGSGLHASGFESDGPEALGDSARSGVPCPAALGARESRSISPLRNVPMCEATSGTKVPDPKVGWNA